MLDLGLIARICYRSLLIPGPMFSDSTMGSQGTAVGPVRLSLEERFQAECLPFLRDIYRSAARVLGDPTRAEDVCQEVFLQAWKSFERFEPGTNCKAWLYKILFHCVHHQRRQWFRFPVLKDTEEFLEANLTAPEPVPEHLTDQEILAALDRIPVDFKAVVLLVDVEEFSYKEAADILAVPIGTVMSRLSRGRKALRELLADLAGSNGLGGQCSTGERES